MDERLRAQLRRIAGEGGPGAADAAAALADRPVRQRLKSAMRALARDRGPGSSRCPSDAARAVGGEHWRDLMLEARGVARELAHSGAVELTQRGRVVDPDGDWCGTIRVRSAARYTPSAG